MSKKEVYYSIYQATRATGLSRYNLEKALAAGDLKSEKEVPGGKTNAKLLIPKSELDRFISDDIHRYQKPELQKKELDTGLFEGYIWGPSSNGTKSCGKDHGYSFGRHTSKLNILSTNSFNRHRCLQTTK